MASCGYTLKDSALNSHKSLNGEIIKVFLREQIIRVVMRQQNISQCTCFRNRT